MKTATVRELRNEFSKLEAWLGDGHQVWIERRGEAIAVLQPISTCPPKPFVMPDFAARQRAIFGDRVFSQEEVDEMRAYELEGEEG
jgi:antitoxin (DNA-binding transcriptional repressor) of toxin-antitoxin stability system